MHKINFYKENNGKEPVKDFFDNIEKNRLMKIASYMKLLTEYGTRIGSPYVKHLKDDL